MPFKLLSNQPKEKEVTAQQPEWIYFALDDRYPEPVTAKLVVDVEFIDGATIQFDLSLSSFWSFKVYHIATGYAELNLGNQQPLNEVYSWTVHIKGVSHNFQTNKQTYYLIPEGQRSQYIIF